MQLRPRRVPVRVTVTGNPTVRSLLLRLPVGRADMTPAGLWAALSPAATTPALHAAEPLKET